jgi:hypothetical protein
LIPRSDRSFCLWPNAISFTLLESLGSRKAVEE